MPVPCGPGERREAYRQGRASRALNRRVHLYPPQKGGTTMPEKSVAMNENGVAVKNKATVKKSRKKKVTVKKSTKSLRAVASSSVPKDWAFEALFTGVHTFRRKNANWE